MKVPHFATAGSESQKIEVRLSYRIVSLFSEGLYASPHKAIEELVANSFDAGARRVSVMLPPDFREQGATIVVVDDGEGMDASGLQKHWLIGKSDKRELVELPLHRQQIGKFGIGKLATYVLANRLTHFSRKGGKFFTTSMNYKRVDERGDDEIEPKTPLRIGLRTLTEDEAIEALEEWTESAAFKASGMKLFGKGASQTWTFAILSDLKEKVFEIQRGRLGWVLRTALPLRDDFAIYYEGERLESSKAGKGLLKRWVLGKDIKELPKPASDELEAHEDKSEDSGSAKRFALEHKDLGRISGYAEAYKDLLTGKKSDQVWRSHGFFVYVRGRLVNEEDGHFGIPPDELRHGTFGRIRIVVHMDGLDEFLKSDRERIREGPVLTVARNILRGIFNKIRAEIDEEDAAESPGARLARKMGGSPTSLARRPIIEMARAAVHGRITPKYIALPKVIADSERTRLIEVLEERAASTPDRFVSGLSFVYESTEDGIAVYDVKTGLLRINGLHPFVGAFFDEFMGKTSGLPLEVFAMAEVLLEGYLYQAELSQDDVDDLMATRDRLLRHVASESGRMTPLMVANALRNATNDQDLLEQWVVESFRSLGFDATRLGGKKRADGVAEAPLAPKAHKVPQRYRVSLEAKSKEKPGSAVSAKTVGVSTIARHRNDLNCEHAIVVGQRFPTGKDESALSIEINQDRKLTKASGEPRTITLIHIEDLARLVQHRPVRALPLQRIRELFKDNSLPEECKAWIDAVLAEQPVRHDYATIVRTIARLQSDERSEPVEYGELRSELRHGKPKIDYPNMDDLRDVCRRMAGLVPDEIEATDHTVSVNQGVQNIISKLEQATKAHLADH